ncbi:MAG: ZIP family metal transporter [Caloramator sp.]|nr:ZIP family metal transporter [Caloramator sp.]
MSILTITLIGTLVCAFGTTLGAFLIVILKKTNNILMSSIIGIAAGLMLSVVTFDLIPESIETGGLLLAVAGTIIGIVFAIILDYFLSFLNIIKKYGKHLKTALLLALALSAHNFPEGLAIGTGFIKGVNFGLKIAIVIAFHDIPEGAAVAAPLLQSSLKRWQILILTALTALPTAIGTYIGAVLGNISNVFVSLCLGFASGTMLYIVVGELIPESKELSKGILSTLSTLLGLLLGLLLVSFFG